jgi:hypothetical protein
LGAFPALRAGNRAFRSKSSDLPMQILWAFRYNPLRPTGFSRFALLIKKSEFYREVEKVKER